MENKFAKFDPSLPSSGSFHVHMHKTENGFYVGVECIKVDERDADFLIEAFASARGCKPVMASTLVSNPINTRELKPTYIQLEKDIEALKSERDSLLAKLALAEADVLQREAQLILTAHETTGCNLSERAKSTLKSIGGIMLTRAALARSKAQGGE